MCRGGRSVRVHVNMRVPCFSKDSHTCRTCMTLRKWSYFRRSEDLTEPLHTRIFLFFSLVLSFLHRNIIETRIHRRFTSGERGKDNIVTYIKQNFDSVTFSLLFLFRCKKDGLRGSRSPDSNGSTASGIPRQRDTARFELSLKNGHVHLDQLFRNDSIVSRVHNTARIRYDISRTTISYDFTILCEHNETDFKRKDASFRVWMLSSSRRRFTCDNYRACKRIRFVGRKGIPWRWKSILGASKTKKKGKKTRRREGKGERIEAKFNEFGGEGRRKGEG